MNKFNQTTLVLGLLLFFPVSTQAAPCPGDPSYTCPDLQIFTLISTSQNDEGFKASTVIPLTNYLSNLIGPPDTVYGVDSSGNFALFPATKSYKCSYTMGSNSIVGDTNTYCSYELSHPSCVGIGGLTMISNGMVPSAGTICYPVGVRITLYQGAPQSASLSVMLSEITAYYNLLFAWFNNYTSPQPPKPLFTQGYRDICQAAHLDPTPVGAEPFIPFYNTDGSAFAYPVSSGTTCELWRNGNSAPTANLIASPSTIVSGNTSALTYTCSNGATSASINNSVGTVSPASSGTVAVSPVTTTTYTLTCTNASGTGTGSATVTVTVSLPDLTASLATPPGATQGTPVTLSATITNAVSAATGAGFTNLFQRATDSSGSNATDIGTAASLALASGANSPATLSYTFPSAGTFYVRVCADKSSSASTGVIPESNEGNNCAGAGGATWTPIIVSPSTPAPTCTFTANPTATVPSTLTWSSTNATSCTGGGFSTGAFNPTSGSVSVSTAGTYTLSCTGAGGSCSNAVTVGGACAGGSPTGTVTATPNRVRATVPTAVTFTLGAIQNVQTSCILTGPSVSRTFPASSCTVGGTSYTPTITLTTQGVYVLTCDGVKTSQVIVNVLPNFTEF